MERLPIDVLVREICQYLSVREVNRLIRVNRHLATLTKSTLLWKYLYNRDLSVLQTFPDYREAYRKFIVSLRENPDHTFVICEHGCDKLVLKHMSQPCLDMFDDCDIIARLGRYNHSKLIDAIKEIHWDPNWSVYLWCGIVSSNHVHLLTYYADVISICASDMKQVNVALTSAAKNGNKEMAAALISMGATNFQGALVVAAQAGHIELVKLFLPVSVIDNLLIEEAAAHNRTDILLLLKEYYWTDDMAQNLAIRLIQAHISIPWETVAFLLQFPIRSYDTLLNYAVRHHQVALVKKLVELGADRSQTQYRSILTSYLPYSDMEYLLSPRDRIVKYLNSLQ